MNNYELENVSVGSSAIDPQGWNLIIELSMEIEGHRGPDVERGPVISIRAFRENKVNIF